MPGPNSEEIFSAMRKAEAAGDTKALEQLKQLYVSQHAREQEAPAAPTGAAGGAAEATPKQGQQKTLEGVASAIGGSTVAGGVMGAATPEIVQGAGRAMQLWGPTRPVGVAVQEAGRAMRLARTSLAVNGAVSGAVSEAAGQVAEAGGASPGAAAAVRIGAGVATPAVGAGTLVAVGALVPRPVKQAWDAVVKFAGTEQKLAERAVDQAKKLLTGDRFSTIPQHDFHAVLKKGVEADLQASEQAAGKVLADAHAQAAKIAQQDERQAQQLVAEAQQKAQQIRESAKARAAVLDKATDGQLARADRVGKQAEQLLQTQVGTPHEVSDIGKALRGKVTAEQEQLIQQREVNFKQLKQQRDLVVQQKEQAGQFVDAVPEMKALKAEISRKLLLTQEGRKAAGGMAEVTEPGVMRAYQSIYDAIANRRVQTGVNEAGNPTYNTFKTSFEALDHVRRKLGDAGWGKADAEGYGALGQQLARDMYLKISGIQQKFVGGDLQQRLQSVYAEGSEKLAKFGTASGRKMTAVDRMDPEAFAKDPASVPKAYFQSQQGVRDLVELTGDPKLVADAAGSYAARSIAGMNAKQAEAWVKGNTDWTREVPGLPQRLQGYVEQLRKVEQYEKSAAGRVEAVQKAKAGVLQGVAPAQDKALRAGAEGAQAVREGVPGKQAAIIAEGEKAAAAIRKDAEAKAAAVLPKGDSPPDTVRKLLTGADLDGLKYTARYIAGHPGGKKALEGSVRNLLAQESPKQIAKLWNERLYEVIKEGRLLDKRALDKLDADVQRVLRAETPLPEKQKVVQKMVAGALAGAGADAGQGGRALKEELER